MAAVPQLQAVLVWRRVEKRGKEEGKVDLGEKLGLLVAKSRIRTSVPRKGFGTVKKPAGGKIATRRKMSKMSCE